MKNTKYLFAILLFTFVFCGFVNAQIILTFSNQVNTVCNGIDCSYNGPTILINEVMLTPASNDGSTFGTGPGFIPGANEGEWLELYNPNKCKPVDISCYFLGNNTNEPNVSLYNLGAGYAIPPGTIVPPRGFVIVRGIYAPPVPSNLLVQNGGNTIELVVDDTSRICLGGGYRLWFPNAGGWFAFYDRNGVPQDAISWNDTTNSYLYGHPCNPISSGCPFTDSLSSYDNIPTTNKTYITSLNPALTPGQSLRRIPDGGPWVLDTTGIPTYGTCNDTCISPPVITCNGTATVYPSGGTSPDTYQWDDSRAQLTSIATGLCAGTYCVTVTDSTGQTSHACVNINNFVPTVTILADGPTDFCEGDTIAVTLSTSIPYYAYDWSSGSVTPSIFVNHAGCYSVAVIDTNGCYAGGQTPVNVRFIPKPVAYINYYASGNYIQFFNYSLFDSTYYWTFGDSSSSILENPTHTYATQGTYNVRFIVTNMCGSDTVNINITIVSGAGIEENNIVQNLVICPIPARDLLNVSFETGNSHGIEIKIVNTLGQLLYNESSESFTGKYNKVFDMLKYQSGIYYLHIITDKGIVNRKIEVN